MVQGGRGGKFRDSPEIVILQIVRSVQAAAGKERVLDAGRQGVPEAYFPVEVVHLFQEAVGTSDPKHLVGMLAAGEHWVWFGMGVNVVEGPKRGREGSEDPLLERTWEDLSLIPLVLF